MAKNILIFSDGTGQAGGIRFDEDRTNVYKLYRATRCGPDSVIDPARQVAFYDPGLGSSADGGRGLIWGKFWGKFGRFLYNLVSQATGLGITGNIIDCYEALIRLYRPGDRVFLFGFSRGAYTVRCLAAVIAKCGIPRSLPGQRPLPLDVAGSQKIAATAVKDVYQFCSSRPRKGAGTYRDFMLDTRGAIARRFREAHQSADPNDPEKANVYPYFIGVFDTVAALSRPGAVVALCVGGVFILGFFSILISSLQAAAGIPLFGWLRYFTAERVFFSLAGLSGAAAAIVFFRDYLKFDFHVPGYGLLKSAATIHVAPPKHKFTEYSLDPNVTYAKHAISIDENRFDFRRVPWAPDAARAGTRDADGNIYFEQVWFAGVHADIGGGYPENESRLSDIALNWMTSAAAVVPDGILYDEAVLRPFPDPVGPQHDECKAGHWQHGLRPLPIERGSGISTATMHRSVYERFEAPAVVQYDVEAEYRPGNLEVHTDFRRYFPGGVPSPATRTALADDIEGKWLAKKASMNGGRDD